VAPDKPILRIKCEKDLWHRFKVFAVTHNWTYEQALKNLLDHWEGKLREVAVEVT